MTRLGKTPKAPRTPKAKTKAAGHIIRLRGDESIANAFFALRPSVYRKEPRKERV